MTLLVVHNNDVYVDRCCVVGDSEYSITKIVSIGEITFATAGLAESGNAAIQKIHNSGDFFTEVSGGDNEHSCVIARNPADGEIYMLDLALDKAMMTKIGLPSKLGLRFMAGTGWRWFHAYMAEHNDLHKALELTATFCRDVASPFDRF